MNDIKLRVNRYGRKYEVGLAEYIKDALTESTDHGGVLEDTQYTARRNSEAIGKLVEMLVAAKVITPVDGLRVADKEHLAGTNGYGESITFLNLPGL